MLKGVAAAIGFTFLTLLPAYGDRYVGGHDGEGGRDSGGGGTYHAAAPVQGTGAGSMFTTQAPQTPQMGQAQTPTTPQMRQQQTPTTPQMEQPRTPTMPQMRQQQTPTMPSMQNSPNAPSSRAPNATPTDGGPRDDSENYYAIGGLWASSWVPWWEMHKNLFLQDPTWRAPRLSGDPEPGYVIAGEPVQAAAPPPPPADVLAFLRRRVDDSDARVARAALVALGKFAQLEDIPRLARALGRGPVPIRQGAAIGLGFHGSLEAGTVLRQALAKEDTPMPVLQMAALALGLTVGGSEDVAELSQVLERRTNDTTLRACAASALGALGKRSDLLVEVLRNPGQPVPCRVACALALAAQEGPPSGLAPGDLLQMYRQQANNEMHRGLALAMGRLLTMQEVDDVVTILRSEQDPVAIHYTMISLCTLGGPEAIQGVRRTLADASSPPVLRAHCALGLAANGRTEAMEDIHKALACVRDRSEQAAMLLALSLLERPQSREDPESQLLSAMLADRSTPDLQGYAGIASFLALEEIGAGGVRKAIVGQDRSPAMLRSGLLALGANRDAQDLQTLYRMLEDPDRYVRGAAAQALGWSGQACVVGDLLSRAGDAAAATLREEACTVLGLLLQPERSRKILAFMDLCEPTHAPDVMFALLESL